MTMFELLACYGLTFGLMNKTLWLQNRSQFASSLLSCSYCTGFHSGWMIYILTSLNEKDIKDVNVLSDLIVYSFASACFCYVLDVVAQRLED